MKNIKDLTNEEVVLKINEWKKVKRTQIGLYSLAIAVGIVSLVLNGLTSLAFIPILVVFVVSKMARYNNYPKEELANELNSRGIIL